MITQINLKPNQIMYLEKKIFCMWFLFVRVKQGKSMFLIPCMNDVRNSLTKLCQKNEIKKQQIDTLKSLSEK